MTITITAFANSPDQGAGLARDMIVRWALEEVEQPYEARLAPWEDFKNPEHRKRQPFGQIPTYEEGDLVLFESGAIVLHIAERFPGLFPKDANARARAIIWMFATVSDVEPLIIQREVMEYLESDKSWAADACRWSSNVSAIGSASFPRSSAVPIESMVSSTRRTCCLCKRCVDSKGRDRRSNFRCLRRTSNAARRARRSSARSRRNWRCFGKRTHNQAAFPGRKGAWPARCCWAVFAVNCAAGAVAPAAAQSYRVSGTPCANEDGRCNFAGTRYVRYGAGDRFTVRLLTDGTDCTNAVFGDPVPNVRKACYLESSIFPTRRCADEDGRCSFLETRIVFYGAGERYAARALANGTACTNAVFGDPAPGVRKACYTEAGSPMRGGAVCANEGGRCAFNGARYVYYGAGDRCTVRLLTNGADCNNTVFGDPTPGVRKSCYVDSRR